MTNVIELVSTILNMDKEIESLKRENQMLKNKSAIASCDCKKDSNEDIKNSYIDELIVEMGLKALYKKVFYSWKSVSATRNDKGEVVYTSFDDFIEEDIRRDEIPEKVSRFEVLEKLRPILLEKYEAKCKIAYDELLEREGSGE